MRPKALLRRLGRHRNPLRRGTDRAEAWLNAVLLIALLLAGPIASLGGVLLGEVVMLLRVQRMARRWKAAHD